MARPLGIAVLLVLIELARPAGGHWPPGSMAALGLVGSLVLAGLAKGLAAAGIARPERTDD